MKMFKTFRQRLLFWFLVFIGSSIIIIGLSITYLQERERIFVISNKVVVSYFMTLKNVKAQQDFFSYETKSTDYFETYQSRYLDEYNQWYDSTTNILKQVDFDGETGLNKAIDSVQAESKAIDSLFKDLVKLINQRGFKDYGLEGAMREEVHWLEAIDEIPAKDILSLRRHEKDFIIRNESSYVDKLTALADEIAKNLKDRPIPSKRKEEILLRLSNYKSYFLQLVALDKSIGIKDNSGLKKELDDQISTLEGQFSRVVRAARRWTEEKYHQLTLYFVSLSIVLLLGSTILSAFIANRITQPLTELTVHITQFVDSNFTLETDHPVVRTKDEIGKLTENFSILKDEVISRLKFFKQKVDERTAELATANERLRRLSEANSRFVPKEFLHYLGKDSIEQVKLGDQTEGRMTVMFTDIRDFTKISENLSPQQNFDFINSYLKGIVPIIQKHGGFIDKYIGDSVMALFPNDPDDAIKAAIAFEDFIEDFNKEREPIRIGTGLHTGQLILGTIGHDNRLETTVISDSVNTASRVEGLTKHYGAKIVASEDTLDLMVNKSGFDFRFLDEVKVKGKSKTLSVYEFLPPQEKMKLSYLTAYNKGVALIEERNISEAMKVFEHLHQLNPNDAAVEMFLVRCIKFFKKKDKEWDQIVLMTSK